jgi:hypothetical protein
MVMRKDGLAFTMWEFLPGNIQESLEMAIHVNLQKERSERQTPDRICPHCGHDDAIDCGQVKDLNDTTIGLCLICGYLWCLECDAALLTTVNCGHWHVCASCAEEKDLSGYCGRIPWECPHIRDWLARNHPTV